MKIPHECIGNQTRDLPACSIVLQQNESLYTPSSVTVMEKTEKVKVLRISSNKEILFILLILRKETVQIKTHHYYYYFFY